MPNGHVNWLRYRAAFGIHSVMLHQEPLEDVKSIQDQAIDAGLEDTHAYETSVMILDTFLSDETDRHVLKRVFRDPAAFPSVQILLADPFGEFARRQHSVVINTLKPVQKTILGLQNIASALGVELPSLSELPPEVTRDRLKPIIQEVKTLCKTHNIELRFFDAFPYGPMYFYRGILVAGRFGVAKDCEELPWYMILDDTRCEHDLFDHSRAEFEVIWNKSEKAFTDAESPVVSAGQSKTHFDVFLICALQEEFDALKNLPGLEWEPEGDIRSDNQEYYKATLMTDSGAKLSLVAAVPSRMGNTAAACLASKAIAKFHPRLVIIVGIAAGVKSSTRNYGDILVAEQAVDYSSGKVVHDERGNAEFLPDFIPVHLPPRVEQRLRGLREEGLDAIWRRWRGPKPDRLRIHIGPVASGDMVVAHESVMDEVKKHWRRLVGLEMEVYGTYYAAFTAAEPVPLFCSFKSVCDFADIAKDANQANQYREYAAFTAAEYCHFFLRSKAAELLPPRKEDSM